MAYRINFLLVLALIACSLALVDSQHRARKLFIDLERAQTRSKELDIQWKQLDQLQLAKASMIDLKARRDLGMISASADRTVYLTMPPLALRRQDASLAMAAGQAANKPAAQGALPALELQTPAEPGP